MPSVKKYQKLAGDVGAMSIGLGTSAAITSRAGQQAQQVKPLGGSIADVVGFGRIGVTVGAGSVALGAAKKLKKSYRY